jgi:hypothetical protein
MATATPVETTTCAQRKENGPLQSGTETVTGPAPPVKVLPMVCTTTLFCITSMVAPFHPSPNESVITKL